MNRRRFLGTAALALPLLPGALPRLLADSPGEPPPSPLPFPVIDTHIHLYDPFRPQGAPWPQKRNAVLYRTSLPSRYRPIAEPLGIVGAIEIECSSWVEDNQWVLDVAAQDDIMVGTVGHLVPGTPDFRRQLERFHRNPLFRGIRYGLGRQQGRELERPEFIADLKALAAADLVLDTANPSVGLLADVVRLSDRIPELRIVIDHLPQMLPPPSGTAARGSFDASMKAFQSRPQVYTKVSEVLRFVDPHGAFVAPDFSGNHPADARIPTDTAFYRPQLDAILEVFGPDRVLYGSDWPNGDQWLPVPAGFQVVREYFLGLGRPAAEKYFWRNSLACYKWVKRNGRQPG
jgi:L-fuconolactonase